MRESDLLAHIYSRSAGLAAEHPHVLVGPGDDCAVVRDPRGEPLLLKVDQLVESRHFHPHPRTPLDLIARKALARPLSDIAAMGGRPLCALVAATLPTPCPYADELFDAMSRWALHWGCPLVGGDIASAPGARLMLSVTLVGAPHADRGPVLRSTAKPGDIVYVTGKLGGSLDRQTGLGRHLTFEPRLREAAMLCGALGDRLNALMDLSDGLGIDGSRLAEASSVRLELDARAIPLGPGVPDWRAACSEGEDYELLFTTDAVGDLPELPVPVTAIGRVHSGSGCLIRTPDHHLHDVSTLGWDPET